MPCSRPLVPLPLPYQRVCCCASDGGAYMSASIHSNSLLSNSLIVRRSAMRVSASLLIFAILVNTAFLLNHGAGHDALNQTAGITVEATVISAVLRGISTRPTVGATYREAVHVLVGERAFVLFEIVEKAHSSSSGFGGLTYCTLRSTSAPNFR